MTPTYTPPWPIPLMAFAQAWVASSLIAPLRESGGPWDWGYAASAATFGLVGVAVLGLAARNCLRLWRVRPCEASWSLVLAAGLMALLTCMMAIGPITSGVWRWESVVTGALSGFLLVGMVREVSRLTWRRTAARPALQSQ